MSDKLRAAAEAAIGAMVRAAITGHSDALDGCAEALRAALADADAEPMMHDGWLQDGGLLYRLTDDRRPKNRDEINVTMADGSRSAEARARRASELLDCIRSVPQNRREWQSLTKNERQQLLETTHPDSRWTLAERVEAALKDKNGGGG